MVIDDAWIAERERLANAATPGPYWIPPGGDDARFSERVAMRNGDWRFLADARSAFPALIAEVRRLREENTKLRGLLAEVAGSGVELCETIACAISSSRSGVTCGRR